MIVASQSQPRFSLGQVVATPGALEALASSSQTPEEFLKRHIQGNWGDVCEDDKQANEAALLHGERLLSSYRTSKSVKLWIITEADRSATTLLLPEEY